MNGSNAPNDEHYSPTWPPEGLSNVTASSVYNYSFYNEPAPASVYKIIGKIELSTNMFLMPVGFLLNLLNVIVFVKSRIAWTSVGLHMMFLAIADNLVLFSGFVINTSFWQYIINIPDLWSLNSFTCGAAYYIVDVSFTWSGFLLVSSTVERFMVVALPLKVKSWNLYKKSKILMVLYFLLSILICLYNPFCYIIIKHNNTNFCLPSEKYKDFCYFSTMVVNVVIANVLCFTLTFVFTVLISIALYKYKQKRVELGTSSDTGREIRLTLMLLTVAGLFLFLRVGEMVLHFIIYFGNMPSSLSDLVNGIYLIFLILLCLNHGINFVVYVVFLGNFRKTLLAIFCSCIRSDPKTSIPSSTSITTVGN